jgi:hypothetical protein
LACHLRFQEGEVIGEFQSATGEGDAGAELGAQIKGIVGDAQLPEKLDQGCAFGSFRHIIGHGMEADVVFTAFNAVKGIEPTRGVMPFKDEDLAPRECEPNAGGHTCHARANNDGFVVRLRKGRGSHTY